MTLTPTARLGTPARRGALWRSRAGPPPPPLAPPGFSLVGGGNCMPNLPNAFSYNCSNVGCAAACATAGLCLGYDWGPSGNSLGACRARFPLPPKVLPRGFKLESPDGQWCLAGHKLALSACDAEGLPPQWVVGDAVTGELEWAASGGGNASLCIKLHEEPGWDCANVDPDKTARRRNPSAAFHSTLARTAAPRAVASPNCLNGFT